MKDPDEIILRYLQENISLEDQHQLTKWLEENDYNEEVIKKVKSYWQNYTQDFSGKKKAVEKQVFKNISLLKSGKQRSIIGSKSYYSAAALIFILCTAAALYWYAYGPGIETGEIVTPVKLVEKASLAGQKITTTLPDGTTVHLNSGSKLIVPEKFSDVIRSVELTGEAFFDVEKNELKPFHITTKDFTVSVLGTSFNVNAYKGSASFVAVKEGVVSVKSDSNIAVEINADQMVEIKEDGSFSDLYEVDDIMAFGWIDRVLFFEDQTIDQVLEKISLWYGVEIEDRNQKIPEKSFTATFNNPTLKELMVNVSKVYGFEYDIKDKHVVIR